MTPLREQQLRQPGDFILKYPPGVPSVYLAHPYSKRVQGEAFQAKLEGMGLYVFNPFDRPDQHTYDTLIKEDGLTFKHCESIVRGDLIKLNAASLLFAYMPDVQTIGTCMEIYHAAVIKHIPVFILTEKFGLNHPWLVTYSSFITNEEDQIFAAIKQAIE
jgi:hypothetical protein